MTGPAVGQTVLIPRIPMIPNDLPFNFKRIQFLVKLLFAVTINKAQGQTLNSFNSTTNFMNKKMGYQWVAPPQESCQKSSYKTWRMNIFTISQENIK